MLLGFLKDFSWYNEPFNVRFKEEGVHVEAKTQTDFWQCKEHNFQKDDGHFFYVEKSDSFNLSIKWHCDEQTAFAQCGLMVRFDNFNWFKIAVLSPNPKQPQLGVVVTTDGQSDWSSHPVTQITDIWYKAKVQNGNCSVYYSLDGKTYHQIRMFYANSLKNCSTIKAGAYICSPRLSGFNALLEAIDFE